MDMPNISVNYTNDKLFTVTLKDDTGTVVDLTNCVVEFTVKTKSLINDIDNTDTNALLTKTISSFADPETGVFTFSITASDTITLGIGKFYYDFKVINLSTLQYSTRPGELEVLRVVTQRS